MELAVKETDGMGEENTISKGNKDPFGEPDHLICMWVCLGRSGVDFEPRLMKSLFQLPGVQVFLYPAPIPEVIRNMRVFPGAEEARLTAFERRWEEVRASGPTLGVFHVELI